MGDQTPSRNGGRKEGAEEVEEKEEEEPEERSRSREEREKRGRARGAEKSGMESL